jgi:hypothetical protein
MWPVLIRIPTWMIGINGVTASSRGAVAADGICPPSSRREEFHQDGRIRTRENGHGGRGHD